MPPSQWRTISDWQNASVRPELRARELLRRANKLTPAQRRAVWAWLPDEQSLAHQFSQASVSKAPLAGVPFVLKDLFSLLGTRTRAGAPLPDRLAPVATRDSALVQRLRSAGAVCAGKTQLHEFAYGLTGENATHGHCTLPGHPDRTAGGSSSGSAAAVAAGIVPFAIGTDTGGSIRVPAAFCGLHGVRLAPRDEWIDDAFPLSPSFDSAGWFAGSAEDLKRVSEVILKGTKARKLRRGLSLTFADLGVEADESVSKATSRAARRLAPAADAEIVADFKTLLETTSEAYAVINSTEAFRFHEQWLALRPSFYSKPVRQRIERGAQWSPEVLAAACEVCLEVRNWFTEFFRAYDFLVLPVAPFPALTKRQCSLRNRLRLLELTTPASVAGLPVRTIPVPLPGGLHAGLQIITRDRAALLGSLAL